MIYSDIDTIQFTKHDKSFVEDCSTPVLLHMLLEYIKNLKTYNNACEACF